MWKIIKNVFKIVLLCVFSFICIVFLDLILLRFTNGSIFKISQLLRSACLCILCLLSIYGTCLVFYKSKIIYKIVVLVLVLSSILLFFLYLFNNSDFLSRFKSVNDLREYIKSFNNAPLIYVIIQFFQVVMLPIPSIIITGAGVLLFGPLKCAVLSCIGVILGSISSFFIGRILGYRFISWFFGKELVDKWLNKIESKSKIFLIIAFIFPFFPDDTLCALAGVTKIKVFEFLVIVFFTRIISIFISCFTLNNNVIPLNSWWGILIIILFLTAMFFLIKKFIKNT